MASVSLPWKAEEDCFYDPPLPEMLFSLSYSQKTKDAL